MSGEEIGCPFCGKLAGMTSHHQAETVFSDVRGGPFVSTKHFCLSKSGQDRLKGLIHVLSAYIREQMECGRDVPTLDSFDEYAELMKTRRIPRSSPTWPAAVFPGRSWNDTFRTRDAD
jgi:hypothetical protein